MPSSGSSAAHTARRRQCRHIRSCHHRKRTEHQPHLRKMPIRLAMRPRSDIGIVVNRIEVGVVLAVFGSTVTPRVDVVLL